MRFLFTFVGGRGHLGPLLPFARAAHAAGHEVAFACRPSMVATVQGHGFDATAVGPDVAEPTEVAALLEPDAAREERVLSEGFAGVTANRRAGELLELAKRHRPDLVVADEVDFGALVAAEVLGVAHASVVVLAAGGFARPDLLAGPLDRVRARFGLGNDPDLGMLRRHLVLAPFPPQLRDPAYPLPPSAVHVRPAALDPATTARGRRTDHDRPRVYVTLGTVFNMESGDLFDRLLSAVAGLDADVVMAVGERFPTARLTDAPGHVRVEAFVDQPELLATADAVVCHGGSGTVVGALAHGAPLVLLPMGGDQPHNARRCEALGVGVAVDVVRSTPATIREATAAVLRDEDARARARELARRSEELPTADAVLDRMEALAR